METGDHSKNGASPKSHTNRKNLLMFTVLAFVACAFVFASCKKDDDSGFGSPEEYIENPSVSGAIDDSGIPIYEGDTPPALAGTYLLDGEVTDASSLLNELIGAPMGSEFILSKQTVSGKIDLEERVGGLKGTGSGGYITGANGHFTIYIESKQSGSEAGLPHDVSVTVVLLMSGTKASNGDLINVEGLTVFTHASSSNKSYDLNAIKGLWYKWEADFYLQKEVKSSATLTECFSTKTLMEMAFNAFLKSN